MNISRNKTGSISLFRMRVLVFESIDDLFYKQNNQFISVTIRMNKE